MENTDEVRGGAGDGWQTHAQYQRARAFLQWGAGRRQLRVPLCASPMAQILPSASRKTTAQGTLIPTLEVDGTIRRSNSSTSGLLRPGLVAKLRLSWEHLDQSERGTGAEEEKLI